MKETCRYCGAKKTNSGRLKYYGKYCQKSSCVLADKDGSE